MTITTVTYEVVLEGHGSGGGTWEGEEGGRRRETRRAGVELASGDALNGRSGTLLQLSSVAGSGLRSISAMQIAVLPEVERPKLISFNISIIGFISTPQNSTPGVSRPFDLPWADSELYWSHHRL